MYCLLMASVNIEADKVLEMLTVEPFYSSSYVKDNPMIKKIRGTTKQQSSAWLSII